MKRPEVPKFPIRRRFWRNVVKEDVKNGKSNDDILVKLRNMHATVVSRNALNVMRRKIVKKAWKLHGDDMKS